MKALLVGSLVGLGLSIICLWLLWRLVRWAKKSGEDDLLSDLRKQENDHLAKRKKNEDSIRDRHKANRSRIPNDWDTIRRMRKKRLKDKSNSRAAV